MSIPEDAARMPAELWHPWWCDREQCTAGQVASYHKSTPRVVPPQRHDFLKISVTLWQDADEPDTTAVADVVLVMDETSPVGMPQVRSYSLDLGQVEDLIAGLAPLRDILAARGSR